MKSGRILILWCVTTLLLGTNDKATANDTIGKTTFSVTKVLGSNMVVQRDKPFKVWGQAPAGHSIMVKASWNNKSFSAIATKRGDWEIAIPAAKATAIAQTIVVKDNGVDAVTFSNILIGDVWVCSGQSNMSMVIDSVSTWPGGPGIKDYKAEIAAANHPNIRLAEVPYGRPPVPADTLTREAKWTVCSPATAKNYSAIAYFFGRKLNKELNVPIGLVVSALGATSGQEWSSPEVIAKNPYYAAKNASLLYNGMIYPLRKLAIKGFLWDQGEGNRNDPPMYYTYLNSAMIKDWRAIFKQGDLPFYYVQMTPYASRFFQTKPWGDDPKATDYALFREYQTEVRKITPNTGMCINMDIDEIVNIHWQNKKPTAERLALLALNQTYGKPVQCNGPQFLNITKQGNKSVVNFVKGTAGGLTTADGQALQQHFYMAGRDSVFRQADAVIKGNTIELTPPADLPLPVIATRYAFTNFPVTNLQNAAGLPAEPFRTDKWAK